MDRLLVEPLRAGAARRRAGSAGEGLGAEAAPRHEGGHGEIDQVDHDRYRLATAEARDHRANKQQHRTGSSQRHQNRRDVERGGQDQARRRQELEGSDGLEGTGAEVFDPSRGGAHAGHLLLGHEQLGAAEQEDNGQQSGNDPQNEVQREVHEDLLAGLSAIRASVLLAVRLGQRESHEDCQDLRRDLTRRGLRAPWLVVSDGAPGLIKAIEEVWPQADRGRCAVHKLRNVVAKLPDRPGLHEEIKRAYWAALDEATDPTDAEQRLRELVAELERPYPSAAACLAADLVAVCIHLKYFPRLRKRFRSSNLLERSLEEVRRRTKVIGRFPGETSCLSLCWAVLDLFLAGARGLALSDLEYMEVGHMKITPAQRAEAQ